VQDHILTDFGSQRDAIFDPGFHTAGVVAAITFPLVAAGEWADLLAIDGRATFNGMGNRVAALCGKVGSKRRRYRSSTMTAFDSACSSSQVYLARCRSMDAEI